MLLDVAAADVLVQSGRPRRRRRVVAQDFKMTVVREKDNSDGDSEEEAAK